MWLCRRAAATGIDAFHIGGAAGPQGWDAPVSASAVAEWRKALSQPPAASVTNDQHYWHLGLLSALSTPAL
ncbi:hypothetical protein Sros01_80010 [Streptomyces roseochromogenus]|nr:hypothetical protein Sros01_80010 [Streptomyces roseochromogenus]